MLFGTQILMASPTPIQKIKYSTIFVTLISGINVTVNKINSISRDNFINNDFKAKCIDAHSHVNTES